MQETHAFWFAALVDGEGSIVIRQRPNRPNPVVCIAVAQNDRRLLDRAVEFIQCGHIYCGIGPRRNAHQLQINRRADVIRILTAIEPHLVLKQDKARSALGALLAI